MLASGAAALGQTAQPPEVPFGQQPLLKPAPIPGATQTPAAPQYPAPAPAVTAPAPTGGQGGAAPLLTQTDDRAALEQMFKEQLQAAYPLTPAQERELLEKNEQSARGKARQAPEFSTVMRDVPLDPASPIPTVEMDLGQPTAVSFTDITGQPWPIVDCVWPAGFEGSKFQEGDHVVVLKTTSLVEHGALICHLKGLTTQARMILNTGNHKHYVEVDARVPRNGPNAKPAPYDLGGAQLVAGNDTMSMFLYGIPPSEAKPVEALGGGVQTKAWIYNGELWVRTPMVLLSPTPHQQNGREGVHVYSFTKLSPVLSMDDDGHDVSITIKGIRVVRANIPQNVLNGRPDAGPTMLVTDGGDVPLSLGDRK